MAGGAGRVRHLAEAHVARQRAQQRGLAGVGVADDGHAQDVAHRGFVSVLQPGARGGGVHEHELALCASAGAIDGVAGACIVRGRTGEPDAGQAFAPLTQPPRLRRPGAALHRAVRRRASAALPASAASRTSRPASQTRIDCA